MENNPIDGKIVEREDIEFYKDYKPEKNIFGEFDLSNKPIQIGKVNKGGQGERIYHPDGHAITLSAYGGGVGAKTGFPISYIFKPTTTTSSIPIKIL